MSKKAQHSNGDADAAAKTNPINNTSAEDKENTAIAAVVRNLSIFRDGPGRGKSDALGYLWELERESKEAAARNRYLNLGGTGGGKSKAWTAPTRRPDRMEEFWDSNSNTLLKKTIDPYKLAASDGKTRFSRGQQ